MNEAATDEDKFLGHQDIMLEIDDDDERWKPRDGEVHETRWRRPIRCTHEQA